MLAEKV